MPLRSPGGPAPVDTEQVQSLPAGPRPTVSFFSFQKPFSIFRNAGCRTGSYALGVQSSPATAPEKIFEKPVVMVMAARSSCLSMSLS